MTEIGAALKYYESQKQFGKVCLEIKKQTESPQEDHKGHED